MIMKSTTITTSVRFEAAHRQYGDPSKCGHLHGHNWKADVSISGEVKDALGYLVDFKDIKELIREKYDHKVILHVEDPLVALLTSAEQEVAVIGMNPTCENLANIVANDIGRLVEGKANIYYVNVQVYENDESSAMSSWVRENDTQ